eukprot:11128-Heterococcus_DN1.PRE.5
MECGNCFNEDSSVTEACTECHINMCAPCSVDDFKGYCPVCDVDIVNLPRPCKECEQLNTLCDVMECPVCYEVICKQCFGNWRHDCVSDVSDSEDECSEWTNTSKNSNNSITATNDNRACTIKRNIHTLGFLNGTVAFSFTIAASTVCVDVLFGFAALTFNRSPVAKLVLIAASFVIVALVLTLVISNKFAFVTVLSAVLRKTAVVVASGSVTLPLYVRVLTPATVAYILEEFILIAMGSIEHFRVLGIVIEDIDIVRTL